MDISEIRYKNLQRLREEAGSWAGLAASVDSSSNYFYQLKAGIRGIGSGLARRLEHAFNKPHGWMDVSHENEDVETEYPEKSHKTVTIEELANNNSIDLELLTESISLVEQAALGLDVQPSQKASAIAAIYLQKLTKNDSIQGAANAIILASLLSRTDPQE